MSEIDQMPAGAELDLLIETEIFGSIPLTDDEWNLCLAMMEYRDPYFPAPDKRMIKVTTTEPTHFMKLMFRLQWPRQFSTESLGDQSRYLVEHMRYQGWLFSLYEVPDAGERTRRLASFEMMPRQYVKGCQAKAEGWTDPHAIALAALKAVRAFKSIANTL